MASVSVVIPTHNRQDVLLLALDHLQSGSLVPDEVIVVDDGSDTPVESTLRAQDFDFCLKVLRFETGRGAPAARNAGMRAATSDLLVMIDDDIFVDHHAIRYHHRIHEARPEPTYAVMGRIYFDPDLVRTPLMHFLEEYDCFQGISKAPDKSRAVSGLISANFSLKRSFLEGKELFDESFPFNRNEDTEFGLRLMEHGLELRFHIAPSARHHSPLALDTHFRQVWKGGFSKAYWALKRPDDSKNCLQLGTVVSRKHHERSFMATFEAYVDAFGSEFLNRDILECSPRVFDAFGFFVKTSTGWFQALGAADGWAELVPGFAGASEEIRRGIDSEHSQQRIGHLHSAFARLNGFLPMALLLSDELAAAKRYDEASEALHGFEAAVWCKIRLADLALRRGRYAECEAYLREGWEATRFGRATDWDQRNAMSDTLRSLRKKHRVDPEWIEAVSAATTDEDAMRSASWVESVLGDAGDPGAFPAVADTSALSRCEAQLKDIGRSAHYVPGRHSAARRLYSYLTDERHGTMSKLFKEIAELAQAVSAKRRTSALGREYR